MSLYYDNPSVHPLSKDRHGRSTIYALRPHTLHFIAMFMNSYERDCLAATATHFQNAVRVQSENTMERYRRLAAVFTTPVIAMSSSMYKTLQNSLDSLLTAFFR